jgi:hypothetical protein
LIDQRSTPQASAAEKWGLALVGRFPRFARRDCCDKLESGAAGDFREYLCANPTARQDRGYGVTSALALAVEAAEALCTFLSDCDPWPDRRSAPIRALCPVRPTKEHHMHATIRRYEGVDTTRINDVVSRVDETFIPQIRELPGFAGYFLMEADNGVLSSISLFETPEQADESMKLVSKWISDENFSRAIPNPPKITSGKVVAQVVPALV